MTQRKACVALGIILGLVLTGEAWCAGVSNEHSMISISAAAKKPSRQRPDPGQIACTIDGCRRIPPGCRPETGYNWDGIPTGFDIVVCDPQRGRSR